MRSTSSHTLLRPVGIKCENVNSELTLLAGVEQREKIKVEHSSYKHHTQVEKDLINFRQVGPSKYATKDLF